MQVKILQMQNLISYIMLWDPLSTHFNPLAICLSRVVTNCKLFALKDKVSTWGNKEINFISNIHEFERSQLSLSAILPKWFALPPFLVCPLERGVDANRNSRGVYSWEFLVRVCRPVLQIPLFFFVNFSPALYYLDAWNRLPYRRQRASPHVFPPPPHPGRTP